MMRFFTLGLTYSLLLAGAAFAADCSLVLTPNAITANWSSNFQAQIVQVKVQKTTLAACEFALGFSWGGGGDFLARRAMASTGLTYQLYKDPALTKILKDSPHITTSDEYILGSLPEGVGAETNYTFYFALPFDINPDTQYPHAGIYHDDFSISAYQETAPPFNTLRDTKDVSVDVTVERMVDMSLVPRGAVFDTNSKTRAVNLGTITGGGSQSLDLVLKSNVAFSVTFTSTNLGLLKKGSSKVPYQMYANENIVLLGAPGAAGPVGAGTTKLTGDSYPIRIDVPPLDLTSAVSGEHTDSITVNVTATE